MTALLAITGAALYGAADYLGGFASRRESPVAVSALSQVVGALLLLPLLGLIPSEGPITRDLVLGAAGGVAGALGLVALYAALGRGPMSLVAPVTASLSAALPAAWDVVAGGWPSPVTGLGLALAFVAILSVSAPDRRADAADRLSPRVLLLSLAAGTAFATFFIALSYTDPVAGVWPLAGARAASVPVLLALTLARRRSLSIAKGARLPTVTAGVLDMGANVFVLLALQAGPLAVAAVLSALYPGGTVVLAWVFLKERPDLRHKAGIALALVAVALTAAG